MSNARSAYQGTPWILALLVAVICLNVVDRQIVAILAVPIKAELGLSDAQLAIMTGLAFSVFYSLIGVPIAHFADRGDRVKILSISIALWSLMTALGAAARSYGVLLLARAGVAVGEAGCNPATQSLLADYYPPERRGLAQGVLVTAVPISGLLALVLGGFVAEEFGWRAALLLAAAPGLLLAPIVWFALPEPRRAETRQPERRRLAADFGALLRARGLVWLIGAAALGAIQSYALFLWVPTYFVRTYEWSLAQAGFGLGLAVGVGGVIGSIMAGMLADKLRSRQTGGQLVICTVVTGLGAPLLAAMLYTNSAQLAIACFLAVQVLVAANGAPLYAVLQELAPERSRALAFSLLSLVANIVGMGLAPVGIGMLSDFFEPSMGSGSLGQALWVCVGAQVLSALAFLYTYLSLRRS